MEVPDRFGVGMRKIFKLIILLIVLMQAACTLNTPRKQYHGESRAPSDLAVITGDCDPVCESLVRKRLDIANNFDISISTPMLQEIDGKPGESTLGNDCGGDNSRGVYNNLLIGGLQVELLPGEHEMLVYVDNCKVRYALKHSFKAHLVVGHTYALIQVSKVKSGLFTNEYIVRWFPVLMDVTSGTFLYNGDGLHWLKASQYE